MEKEELEEIARKQCERHAEETLTEPVEIHVDAQDTAWDPVQLRSIFSQQMSMWRRYGSFDVIVDSSLEIVGYVDHDKLEGQGGGMLSRDELLVLFKSEPLIPRTASLVEIQTVQHPTGMQMQRAFLALRWPVGGFHKMEVLVNATRRAIAVVRPLA